MHIAIEDGAGRVQRMQRVEKDVIGTVVFPRWRAGNGQFDRCRSHCRRIKRRKLRRYRLLTLEDIEDAHVFLRRWDRLP